MAVPDKLYAHTPNDNGEWHYLKDHLQSVADLAERFAAGFNASDEAHLAGLLHDLGKYGGLFQRRLQGKERGIDHWSAGAWTALTQHHDLAAAAAIQGHHIGLQQLDKQSLNALNPAKLSGCHRLSLRLSEPDIRVLIDLFRATGFVATTPDHFVYECLQETASAMLDVRMLYSALVDADFLDTEAHFRALPEEGKTYRPQGPDLQPECALRILKTHVEALARNSTASEDINRLRADLFDSCLASGTGCQGLWTLSAPTGAGKTLAMLAFALQHAVTHGLRRVIVVIPYLSIIEQTASVYKSVFQAEFGSEYVLEHHSLAGTRQPGTRDTESEYAQDGGSYRAKLLSENWDAPIVITTSVQMLESLFANRPSACRKLHRLAESVVLFDEVQTLPARLAVTTLATLSRLAERYRGTVVFSTATQPAFSHLDKQVCEAGNSGWQPSEVVPACLKLFDRARRTHVHWPETDSRSPWVDIACAMKDAGQGLCIVNVKKHARKLFEALKAEGANELYHLSTAMCPAHRQAVLSRVRHCLDIKTPQPCLLVSTQCVEAGVDVDFPTVYRAFGPLESIAQAAGRCNRHGNREVGEVSVFIPEEEAYPRGGGYEQAADITRVLLRERGTERMDIDDPGLFDVYYRRLYDLTGIHEQSAELATAIRLQDFAEVAKRYRLIPNDSINVLVPYDGNYDVLREEVAPGITGAWMRKARPYTVSVFRPKPGDLIWQYLLPAPIAKGGSSDEWFIYDGKGYDKDLGLMPPDAPPIWSV